MDTNSKTLFLTSKQWTGICVVRLTASKKIPIFNICIVIDVMLVTNPTAVISQVVPIYTGNKPFRSVIFKSPKCNEKILIRIRFEFSVFKCGYLYAGQHVANASHQIQLEAPLFGTQHHAARSRKKFKQWIIHVFLNVFCVLLYHKIFFFIYSICFVCIRI